MRSSPCAFIENLKNNTSGEISRSGAPQTVLFAIHISCNFKNMILDSRFVMSRLTKPFTLICTSSVCKAFVAVQVMIC